MTPLLLPALPDRLAAIILGLRAALAAACGRDRALAPLGLLLWRLLLARFRAAVAREGVGQPPRPPRNERAASPRSPRPGSPRPGSPRPGVPRGFGALIRLVPAAAACGSQLQALLNEPEMVALLRRSPQARRTLWPLCQMRGLRPDPALFPPPVSRPDCAAAVRRNADCRSAAARLAASAPRSGGA